MVRYLVTRSKTADGERFGIAVQDGQDMVDSIDDVAFTLSQTMELAVFLQENGVAAVHFRDVLEDWLAR